jgi:hypothetical protein
VFGDDSECNGDEWKRVGRGRGFAVLLVGEGESERQGGCEKTTAARPPV